MRKYLVLAALFTLSLGSVQAVTYKLFVHGRSSKNHCGTFNGVNSGTVDVNGYWSGWGYTPNTTNVRYVGFYGEASGGAYSWSNCGAQLQLNQALNTFCTGTNDCEIYTHSTGGLVVSAFFGKYPYTASWYNIRRIQLLASAAGGSELANIANTFLGWTGWSNYGGELDHSVSTSGARNGFNHYQSGGLRYYTTSGIGKDSETFYITWMFLPGYDDGVVANHSLCSVNRVADVDVRCTTGNAMMRESYRCGFLWLSTCYDNYYRWTPFYTVFSGGSSDTHKTAMRDWYRR
ncbi:MAG: hypothetical protein HS115_19015 [Spirochaetales bacterium]|nr:hypothetical protein [Spirochaetales bacterium]